MLWGEIRRQFLLEVEGLKSNLNSNNAKFVSFISNLVLYQMLIAFH